MGNVRKGHLTPSPQWAKHLRDWKRFFWKGERQAVKDEVRDQVSDTDPEPVLETKPEPKIVDTRVTAWSPY